jgi:hypothetical protein
MLGAVDPQSQSWQRQTGEEISQRLGAADAPDPHFYQDVRSRSVPLDDEFGGQSMLVSKFR